MATDDLGPEPIYEEREITRPCSCRGCRQRFKVGTDSDVGDTAFVYRNEEGTYTRYHEECWPWAK